MFLSTSLGVLRFLPELYDVGHFVVVQYFTPSRYRAGRIGSCGGFSLRSTLSTDLSSAVLAYSLSNVVHLSRFFATLIHVRVSFQSLHAWGIS